MLSVSNWLKNAEISEDLKLRTKGNKSSIFYVNRTVSHSCRLPLCRACLSQLDIRRGMGEVASQWVLCSQKSSLLVYPCVCVCVCVWQGACVHFLNPKEGVPECPNCHFCILSSGTSFLRTADALRCWRRGQENEDRSKRRNARKATWISFSWCDKSMCFFCFFFFFFLDDGDISLRVLFKDLSWNLVLSLLAFHLSSLTWKLLSCFFF